MGGGWEGNLPLGGGEQRVSVTQMCATCGHMCFMDSMSPLKTGPQPRLCSRFLALPSPYLGLRY